MTQAEVETALVAKVKTLTTETLTSICRQLARDCSSPAGIVTGAVLAELSGRMPSDRFVAFCDELYNAMD